MSVPTIVVSPTPIPSTIQIATPFSYTFDNSGIYDVGFVLKPPEYEFNGNIVITNTDPYSPNNTNFSFSSDNVININGLEYPLATLHVGNTFTVQFPYPTGSFSAFSFGAELVIFREPGVGTQEVRFNSGETFYAYNPGGYFKLTVTSEYVEGVGVGVFQELYANAGDTNPVSSGTFYALSVFRLVMQLNPSADVATPVTINIAAPSITLIVPPSYPYLTVNSGSSALLPYISGIGTTQIVFASMIGFQSIFSPPTLKIIQTVAGVVVRSTSYDFTILPLTITVTPNIVTPLILSAYEPFYYTYSIPDEVVNVFLKVNTGTSSSLLQYISDDVSTFSSGIGITVGGSTQISIDAILNGNTILANSSTTIVTSPTGIIATPPITTGSLNLYKYEPFSYDFSLDPLSENLTLQFTNSSSELQAFCTLASDQRSISFAGTYLVSYSAVLSLKIDLLFGGSIIGTTTILISVGPGRFYEPVLNKNFQFYQYENVSNTCNANPTFSTVADIDSIVITPSIPAGLSFSNVGSNTYYLTGTPFLQTPQSNYQVIGSNSSNGRIVTTTVSMKVNGQLVRISPNVATLSNLTVGTAIEPISFIATQPQSFYATTFNYSWSGLPDGFSFTFSPGNNIHTKDNVIATLSGTPTLAFASAMKSANLYQTRLYGTQTNDTSGAQLSGSVLITFSFGETVLIDVSNSIPLYVKKPLGINDISIKAGSYFSAASLSNVTASSLPIGLGPVSSTMSNYYLTGTPEVANLSGSYTFTATNINGLSRSIEVILPVNPNIVTFSGTSGDVVSLIVSKPLINSYPSGIRFSATSAASTQPLVYSSSITLSIYGLVLNSTSGELTGTPTASLSETTVTIFATDEFGTIGSTSIRLIIAADVFHWPLYTPIYFQNLPITPYQFLISNTDSGRSIQSYSSADLPIGLILNQGGLLTGAATLYTNTGTFHITATTGYSTLTQEYTYTMISDSLLVIEVGGPTPVTSTLFSNVLLETIQYSKNIAINPTYTVTNLLPIQSSNMPSLSVSSSGVMIGDFTNGLVSSYSAVLNASYENASGSTPVAINFTPITVPIMVAAYYTPYVYTGIVPIDQIGYVATTNTYALPGPVSQIWNRSFAMLSNATEGPYTVVSPEISRLGVEYVVGGSDDPAVPGFYSGKYSSTLSNIVWIPEMLEPYEYSGVAAYPGVANDGVDTWVVISLPFQFIESNSTGVWTRAGGVSNTWTLLGRITTSVPTLGYMSPNFIIGNSGLANGYDCNANRIQFANQSDLLTWTTPTSLPNFSNVLRFTTSNTRIVALGSAAPLGVCPLAYSDDQASNWTTVEFTPARLTGVNVVINDLLFANNKWVMVGLDSNSTSFIAYADDLSNWSFYNTTPYAWSAIAFNGNAWTIAGASNANTVDGYVSVSKILTLDTTPWPTQLASSVDGTLFSNLDPLNPTVFKTSRLVNGTYATSNATGVVSLPNFGDLTFTKPTTPLMTLYQYVHYSIPIQAIGTTDFIYYYIPVTPLGFSVNVDDQGITAILSGVSPVNNTQNIVTVYAKTASGYASSNTFTLNTVIPFFVNPQSGASAYTALLRNEVEANAAQNARDQRVFPQVDPLAGPFMAPRAPDVVTPDSCQLNLCKKPCPTCRSM